MICRGDIQSKIRGSDSTQSLSYRRPYGASPLGVLMHSRSPLRDDTFAEPEHPMLPSPSASAVPSISTHRGRFHTLLGISSPAESNKVTVGDRTPYESLGGEGTFGTLTKLQFDPPVHEAPKVLPQLRRVSRLRLEDLRMDSTPFFSRNPNGIGKEGPEEGDHFLRLYRPTPKIIPLPVSPFRPEDRKTTSSQDGKENQPPPVNSSNTSEKGSLAPAASTRTIQTVYHDASGSPCDLDTTIDKIESENNAITESRNPKEAGTESSPEDNALQLLFSRSEIKTLDRKMQSLGLLASMHPDTSPSALTPNISPAVVSSWSMSPPNSAPASPPPPTSLPSTPSRASPASSNFSFCSSNYRGAPSTQYHMPNDSELYLPSLAPPAMHSQNTSAEVSHDIHIAPNGSSTPKKANEQTLRHNQEIDIPENGDAE